MYRPPFENLEEANKEELLRIIMLVNKSWFQKLSFNAKNIKLFVLRSNWVTMKENGKIKE